MGLRGYDPPQKERDKVERMHDKRSELAGIVYDRFSRLVQEDKKEQALGEIMQFLRQMAHPYSGQTEDRITPRTSYARRRSHGKAKTPPASRG